VDVERTADEPLFRRERLVYATYVSLSDRVQFRRNADGRRSKGVLNQKNL